MQQATGFGTPLEGPVTADAVEAALADSWRKIRLAQSEGQPAARASVLTLIVCVADPNATNRVLEAIARLSRQHPSRTIILLPSGETDADDVKVWHATGCTDGADQEQAVCGEQIIIAARGRPVSYLPSLTDQLMLPDLPSFLWWVGDLSGLHEGLFDRLTSLADRLIVDSADFSVLRSSLARLDRLARRRHQPCAPSDLSWARLTPWRELVAQFFDPPALRPLLYRIDSLSIDFNVDHGGGQAQALLLIGWLASQLAWRPENGPGSLIVGSSQRRLRRPDGRVVNVTTNPVGHADIAGLVRVILGANRTATFLVLRQNDNAHVLTEADVSGAPVLRRIARCETGDLSALLADELILFRRDHVYEQALHLTVNLDSGALSTSR